MNLLRRLFFVLYLPLAFVLLSFIYPPQLPKLKLSTSLLFFVYLLTTIRHFTKYHTATDQSASVRLP